MRPKLAMIAEIGMMGIKNRFEAKMLITVEISFAKSLSGN